MSHPPSFGPGDRLGRHELLRLIGGGGFATVWLARTVGPAGFERFSAVKVIRPSRARDRRFQAMLLDEARVVARIAHPNVAQIWELGEDPRSLYFVMEFVDGDSLDEIRYRAEIKGDRLPAGPVLRVLADICSGLHAAHELTDGETSVGLVHRDVSPQNILVARNGVAKLIDFGIAKMRERLTDDTTDGFTKGKVSYMAPEQARGDHVDRRADVWSIGAVAYDLLAGRAPFEGVNDMARMTALIGTDPIDPLPASIPLPIRAVIHRALSRDVRERYATAHHLRLGIEEALDLSGLKTTQDDVAQLFEPLFPPSVWATLSSTSLVAAGMSLPAAPPGSPSDPRGLAMTTSDGGVPIPLTRARRSRTALTLGVGIATIAAGSVVLWNVLPPPRPTAAEPANAPAPRDETANAPAPRDETAEMKKVSAGAPLPAGTSPADMSPAGTPGGTGAASASPIPSSEVMVLTPDLAATPTARPATGAPPPSRVVAPRRVDDDDQIQ